MSRTATPRDLIPEAHHVLGTMLRPFSLGHHLLFARIGSPFEGDPAADATQDNLAVAVFVCAAPYSVTLDAMLRGDWAGEYSRWLRKLKPRFWRASRFTHETEIEKFQQYLAQGYQRAPVWRHKTAAGIEFTAPWECLMISRLMRGGFSYTEAVEHYLPAAWYHYHTQAEIEQADNLTDIVKWRKTFFTEQDADRMAAVTHSN